MRKGSKVGVVCCSNGQSPDKEDKIKGLEHILQEIGLIPVFSNFIFKKRSVFSGTGRERAEALMRFYEDTEIKAIFDISGGDIANEILPYLDFSVIAQSNKKFWGYSDLTTVINAIYAKTGNPSVFYQIRNLIYDNAKTQITDFCSSIFGGTNDLYAFPYVFIQGSRLEGTVIGGNLRCLLKLAGTGYWPDMQDKILLLESQGGAVPQMTTYLSQLKQLGAFDKVNGILLGTFTKMEEEKCSPSITHLVKQYAGAKMSIVKTNQLGHGTDSKGIIIGKSICLIK